jgi:hypothetical protein
MTSQLLSPESLVMVSHGSAACCPPVHPGLAQSCCGNPDEQSGLLHCHSTNAHHPLLPNRQQQTEGTHCQSCTPPPAHRCHPPLSWQQQTLGIMLHLLRSALLRLLLLLLLAHLKDGLLEDRGASSEDGDAAWLD